MTKFLNINKPPTMKQLDCFAQSLKKRGAWALLRFLLVLGGTTYLWHIGSPLVVVGKGVLLIQFSFGLACSANTKPSENDTTAFVSTKEACSLVQSLCGKYPEIKKYVRLVARQNRRLTIGEYYFLQEEVTRIENQQACEGLYSV